MPLGAPLIFLSAPSCIVSIIESFLARYRSSTGIVNLYDSSAASPSSSASAGHRETRKLLKSFTNLTTGITSVAFDGTSQIMAIASRAKKDSLRLVSITSRHTMQEALSILTTFSRTTDSHFVANRILKVADFRYTLRNGHFCRFLGGERICRDRQHERESWAISLASFCSLKCLKLEYSNSRLLFFITALWVVAKGNRLNASM